MSSYKEDLIIILSLARRMADADGEYHDTEKYFIEKLTEAFGVDPSDLEKEINQGDSVESSVQRLHSTEATNLLIEVLSVMASADSQFVEQERVLLEKVIRQTGQSPRSHPFFKALEQRRNVSGIAENPDKFINLFRNKALALGSKE